MSPLAATERPPGPRRKAAAAGPPSWIEVPPRAVVTIPVRPSQRRRRPEESPQNTVPSGSAHRPASTELMRLSGPGSPSSPQPGRPLPATVETRPVLASTRRTRKPYFSPTYMLSWASKNRASGMSTAASGPSSPSPLEARMPLPSTVLTRPVVMSILRMRSFELSHT